MLLPLRLETRFTGAGDDRALQIRVYPDEIQLDGHHEVVSPVEAQGTAELLRRIERAPDDAASEGAWADFWPEHGPGRAAWLASSLRDQPMEGWPGWHLRLAGGRAALTYVDDAGEPAASPLGGPPLALPFSDAGPFGQGTSLTLHLRPETVSADAPHLIWELQEGDSPLLSLRQVGTRLEWIHRTRPDARPRTLESDPCLTKGRWHTLGIHFNARGEIALWVDGQQVAHDTGLDVLSPARPGRSRWMQRLGWDGSTDGDDHPEAFLGGLLDLRLWSSSLSGEDRERLAGVSVEALRRAALRDPELRALLSELRVHVPLGAPGTDRSAPWPTQRELPGQASDERQHAWRLSEGVTSAWRWTTDQPIEPPQGIDRALDLRAGGHLVFEDGAPPTSEDLRPLSTVGPRTWALWLKVVRRPESGTGPILGRWMSVEGHGELPELALGLTEDGHLALAMGVVTGASPRTWTARSREPVESGAWHHLALTLEPEAQRIQLIVDGQEREAFSLPGAPLAMTETPREGDDDSDAPSPRAWSLYLGQSPHASPWDGGAGSAPQALVADLRVWSRVRRPEQLRYERWLPLRGDEPHLLHHLLFSGTADGEQPVDRASRVGADLGLRRTLLLDCDPARALVVADAHPLWRRDAGRRAWPPHWERSSSETPDAQDWAEARNRVRLFPETLRLEGWTWDDRDARWQQILEHEIQRDPSISLEWNPMAAQEGATDDAIRWPFELDAALRVGMAAEIPWPEGSPPLDRLLVMGLCDRGTGDHQALADVLAHQAWSRGLEIIPKGRPTNHEDEQAISEYDHEEARAHYARVFGAGSPPAPDADGPALAAALGLTGVAGPQGWGLDQIPGAEGEQGLAARAAARALWAPALGYTLANLFHGADRPMEAELRAVRGFFVDHVRPDGPYPAVRVGRQPYGVLPVTLLELTPDEELGPPEVATLMRNLRDHWLDRLRRRPGQSPWWRGLRLDESVTDILKEPAYSRRFHLRAVFSPHGLQHLQGMTHLPDLEGDPALRDRLNDLVPDGLAHFPGGGAWPLGGTLRAPAGPFPTAPAVEDGEEEWPDYLSLMKPGWAPALSLLIRELERDGKPIEAMPLAMGLLLLAGDLERAWYSQRQPGSGHRGMSAWVEGLGASQGVEAIHMDVSVPPPRGYDKYWDQLDRLRQRPYAELERWLCGFLDAVSHRVDPWLTGFAARRRARRAGAEIRVGAWGWIEDLSPRQADAWRSWGHVLAPSQAHGVTAGVLAGACVDAQREGRQGGAAPQAVDLSSARVRGAQTLMEGLRRDQELGVLLGYRIERGLSEAVGDPAAPQATRALRRAFPHRVTRHGTSAPEDIEPGRVVDGLALVRAWEQDRSRILQHVDSAAHDGVETVCDDTSADLDALTDLLTAEGVHHLLGQQPERAAVAFDSASRGGLPPERIEVLDTPRETLEVRYRLGLVFPVTWGPLQASRGWAVSPRGELQPDLERYCRQVLGPAQGIPLVDAGEGGSPGDLGDLELGALDLVVLAPKGLGPRTPLGRRLPSAEEGEAPQPPSTALRRRLALARTLHALLVDSRALAPRDLEPGDSPDGELPAQPALISRLRAALNDMKSKVEAIEAAMSQGGGGWGGGLFPDIPLEPLPAPLRNLPVDPGELTLDDLAGAGSSEAGDADPTPLGDAGSRSFDDISVDPSRIWNPADFPDLSGFMDRLRRLARNLDALGSYGISEAQGPGGLFERAEAAVGVAEERIAAAEDHFSGDPGAVDPVQGAHLLFGEDLPVIPTFSPDSPPALQPHDDAELWLDRMAHVRERTRPLQDLLLTGGAVPGSSLHWADGAAELLTVQREADRDGPWAGRLKPDSLPQAGSLALCLLAEPLAVDANRWGGVVVDRWEEKIPDFHEEIAAAYHFDEPQARPPQSILVATDWGSPEAQWEWARISAVLRETLDLVRLREVGPEDLGPLRHLLPLTHLPYRDSAASPHLWTGHMRDDVGDG